MFKRERRKRHIFIIWCNACEVNRLTMKTFKFLSLLKTSVAEFGIGEDARHTKLMDINKF